MQMGREVVKQIFDTKRLNSELPLTSTLVGLIPERNRLALRFIDQIGFKKLAVIPGACYFDKTQSHEAGVLSILSANAYTGH
jgi:hypothetical protein